ncbi:proclotting enzyme-like isoform X2 [Centruroides sculpturatus]|nr:proclotting enzyme-like isoform X2 [Centruroides sculpturatus]
MYGLTVFFLLIFASCLFRETLVKAKKQGGNGKGGQGLPPGLRKQIERGGALPPGLQKQAERGHLPPGLRKKLPPDEQPPEEPPEWDPYEPSRPVNQPVSLFGERGGPPINDSKALKELSDLISESEGRFGLPAIKLYVYVPDAQPYHKFESCKTSNDEEGHCRFLQFCVLPDFFYDTSYFFNQVCMIRRRLVGVCCPDKFFDRWKDYNYVYPQVPPRPTTGLQPPVTVPSVPKPTPPQVYKDCGYNYKTKIVGGIISDPKDWRWMAALMKKKKPYCGGALVSESFVLTAAHCLEGYKESDVEVRLGEFDFRSDDDGLPEDYAVVSIVRHTQFDPFTYRNDIALLKLDRSAITNEYTHPICLPNPNLDYTGLVGIVAGWGTMTYGGVASDVLRQVSLPIWNNSECDGKYSQAITRHYLCAGVRQGKEDSCQGDSGGPLMVEARNNRWMVVGIVSWGVRCADPGFPGVYTRVTEYLEWIRFHMV